MINKYCYTCGTKLKLIPHKLGTYNTETGKPNKITYVQCPKANKLGWWKSLGHCPVNPDTRPLDPLEDKMKKLLVILAVVNCNSMLFAFGGPCGGDPRSIAIIHNHKLSYTSGFIPAAEARKEIEDTECVGHEESCIWWTTYIKDRIEKEVRNGSGCTIIDITVCHWQVQAYLVSALERNGYHTDLTPGWSTDHLTFEERKANKDPGHPDGKTWLSINW